MAPYPSNVDVTRVVPEAVREPRCRQGGLVPYRVLTGLSYPPDRRAEAGEIVDDLPSKSIKWLIRKGHIEEISGGKIKTDPRPVPVETEDEADPDIRIGE